MKAEDVKVGMWVRINFGSGSAHVVERAPDGHAAIVRGTDGVMRAFLPQQIEPWAPSAGEWVYVQECALSARVVKAEGGIVLLRFDDHQEFWWGVASITPCTPPSARPIERARITVDDAPAPPRHSDAQLLAAVKAYAPPEPPRTHNAACPKCGGRAYQGLLNVECVEPVCDDPRTRMPDRMQRVGHKRELVWRAEGRGVFIKHPTKEGAIAAWREAVSRG